MYYAEIIKQRLAIRDVAEIYGFNPSRAGFIPCPFHKEKHDSLKLYEGDRGFYCFGCGSGGSVIDFVRKLFNLDFPQAIQKLNYDFNLGLPLGRKLTIREKQELLRKERECKAQLRAQYEERERRDNQYWTAFDEWKRLSENKRDFAPKTPNEEWHPLFVEALQKLSYVSYLLDLAETERKAV